MRFSGHSGAFSTPGPRHTLGLVYAGATRPREPTILRVLDPFSNPHLAGGR